MVLCKKRGIDAHGLTVSPAELPVPWQRLHISPKITPPLTPLPMYCASQGAKMCAGTLHSVKFTLLCREVSPGWHWLGRTVFGTIWQLTHFNRVAKCCTLQVRVRTSLRRFAISSDRDGRSVLVQSMHNPLGIEADTSISVKRGKTLWQSFLSLLVIDSKDCLMDFCLTSFPSFYLASIANMIGDASVWFAMTLYVSKQFSGYALNVSRSSIQIK